MLVMQGSYEFKNGRATRTITDWIGLDKLSLDTFHSIIINNCFSRKTYNLLNRQKTLTLKDSTKRAAESINHDKLTK